MKTRIIQTVLWSLGLVSFLFISGCSYYKTFQMNELSQKSIHTVTKHKNRTLVKGANTDYYVMSNIRVTETSVKGKLTLILAPMHAPHLDKVFRNKNNKNEPFNPTQVMHIYYNDSLTEGDEVELEFSKMESIEIHENAPGSNAMIPVITTVGVTGAVFATVGVIVLLTSDCACPMVETYNENDTQFHGSLFPGSIFKSLKRTDYLALLNYAMSEDSMVNFRIFNNMPEVEYIDEIKILSVNAEGFSNVSRTDANGFVGYSNTHFPLHNDEDSLKYISEQISLADGEVFTFNQMNNSDDVNSLFVRFTKPKNANQAMLTLVAKQSRWLEEVAMFNFNMIGNKHQQWVEKMDKSDPVKWYVNQKEQGVSMGVYLKTKNDWKFVGQFDNPGTIEYRNLLLELDLTEIEGDEIELKFTSAYRIWDIDQVALSSQYKSNLQVKQLDLGEIWTHDSIEVSKILDGNDNQYLVQEKQGDFFQFKVKNPGANLLFVQGTGYYHIEVTNDKAPNLSFLSRLKKKGGLNQISKELEMYKAMVQVE